jgi:hypothetical protein
LPGLDKSNIVFHFLVDGTTPISGIPPCHLFHETTVLHLDFSDSVPHNVCLGQSRFRLAVELFVRAKQVTKMFVTSILVGASASAQQDIMFTEMTENKGRLSSACGGAVLVTVVVAH